MNAENESLVSLGGDVSGDPNDSQVFDKKKVYTSLTLFTGKKLDQRIDLQNFIEDEDRQETIKLKAGCGVVETFLLNSVLGMPRFLTDLDGEFINHTSKKNKRLTPLKL